MRPHLAAAHVATHQVPRRHGHQVPSGHGQQVPSGHGGERTWATRSSGVLRRGSLHLAHDRHDGVDSIEPAAVEGSRVVGGVIVPCRQLEQRQRGVKLELALVDARQHRVCSGALLGASLCYVFPALIYGAARQKQLERAGTVATARDQLVTALVALLVPFGAFLGILGVWMTLKG